MGNASILLVDNRKAIIESFRKSFSEIEVKHTLFSAANENEAWSMLDGSQKLSPVPKIILIDVNRTKNKGIQFLNAIRNHTDLKSILVFVITDSENEINKAAALNLNIAGYIPMSFESQTLNSFVSVLNEYWNIIEFSSQK
ncbi:Response regulator receiver domain-containing protein [Flavobacterium fryxellicola]|uniref:Two-component response regulator n=1 Tax=Flavobacterium fryxellicola TaxID=249352 RepID=A0A167WBA9_9FLAO|nr:response regulator [Flavobacterium fryxellicola]OAB27194.1 two-component response regulator [Flavobacterium fryxellicola]SHN67834.1 Response regulator receiver domain-containing protein [Flavobacterium fryxellicola]